MARHEPNIRASARTELEADALFSIDGPGQVPADPERQEAIACVLSGSEGWHAAMQRLGGAFAVGEARLMERKAD